ncbi:hypothetical protein [Mesoaciditoga lauensis]|uniref:hypothetical protein n=1 Tax=Mesoaciditoga lauensis TaxID=1495039 RepID=UPI00056A89D5|nr:hypothetical protein [Mesoaciditoga lauensis]
MLKYIVEQGQTVSLYLDYSDKDKNPITPDSFEATITEQATDTKVQTITNYDVIETGSLKVMIDTQNLNAGRHFINLKASLGNYHEEDVIVLDIQNHEGK